MAEEAAKCPEPLCPTSVLPPLGRCQCHLLRGRYPSVIAPTGSCATPVELSPASAFSLVRRVLAGCTQSLLPPGASRRYLLESFLGCWIPYPGGTPCALTCFFHDVIGLPQAKNGSASRVCPTNNDFSQARVPRMQIFLNVPASKFALPQIVPTAAILPQGSRGFYVRAYRALLPPHAPDMLTDRVQVIDGTGTFTLSDSQPCRLLTLLHRLSPASTLLRRDPTSAWTSAGRRCLLPVYRFAPHRSRAVGCPSRTHADLPG